MLGKGLLSITGAGLVEFETGAAQQAVEITAKEVFNGIKEKELFIVLLFHFDHKVLQIRNFQRF